MLQTLAKKIGLLSEAKKTKVAKNELGDQAFVQGKKNAMPARTGSRCRSGRRGHLQRTWRSTSTCQGHAATEFHVNLIGSLRR